MNSHNNPGSAAANAVKASWLPMLVIALAQIQMAFNVSALPVSIGGIVAEFDISPSSVGTALVVYSLAVAGFVMLGAKIGQLFGSRLVFQVTVILHGLAMVGMALSTGSAMMMVMQALAGLAAAALVPTLVVMIAAHYKGGQQAQALGLLGASQAMAGVLAFLVAGALGTLLSWRYAFGIIAIIAVLVILLSFKLKPIERQKINVDWGGAALAALAIILISLGFNSIQDWGLFLATPGAPFTILGMSLSPLMIVVGIMIGQAFFVWARKRNAAHQSTLLALEVLESREERAATYSLFVIAALGPAINFLIPLYIQIVQGRTSMQTAISVIPYSLAIFFGTAMIVRVFDRWAPRLIGRVGFIVVAVGLVMLAFTIRNDWGTPLVILSLIVVGLGEGSLLTLVFNVLVSSSPKELAGDVGALRGTVNNLATGLGTAFASVIAITLLSMIILNSLVNSTIIDVEAVENQIDLDNIDFISNEQLDEVLDESDLSAQQIDKAVTINIDARLQALKISFLILACIALLAVIPSGGLPNYLPEEVPIDCYESDY